MEKTIITIITPFYKGEQFIPQLVDMISKNQKTIEERNLNIAIEYLFVNDYPSIPLSVPDIPGVDVKVVTNETNVGIHKSRVNGLEHCKGEYIVFLDQDDYISSDLVASQFAAIKDADIVVGNGIMDYGKGQLILIRNNFYIKNLKRDHYFLYCHCPIVSPGQCLIKKSSIPQEWKDNILKINCSDDYLLYLLMFQNGAKFEVNETAFIYHHVNVGTNASLNSDNNYDSDLEVIEVLRKTGSKADLKRMHGAAITNKYFREKNFWKYFKYLVRHPKTCFSKIHYMIHVGIVSNRIKKAYKQSEMKGKK